MKDKMTSKRDENGLVAILVATMIMIIMSLVVLGFARLMQREQRAAVDKSLSTQAFYAAESGINDAVARVHDDTLPEIDNKDTCNTAAGNPSGLVGSIDTTLDTSYSCLIINKAPATLEYTQKSIKTDQSTIVPIAGANNETITSLEVSWGDETLTSPTYRSCPTSTTSFPTLNTWGNSPGILQVGLIPSDGRAITGMNITRAQLIVNAMSVYLYPVASSAVCGANSFAYASYTNTNAGQVVPVKCSVATGRHECVTTITGLVSKTYYLNMRSIYDPSNVTIKAFDATGTQLSIKGAQVLIDSTGRVGDVVRRLQVRAPFRPRYNVPDDALESTLTICKQLSVVPSVSVANACSL